MSFIRFCLISLIIATHFLPTAHGASSETLDFSRAVVFVPKHFSGPAAKAVEVLIDEIYKRSGIKLPCQHNWPDEASCVIAVGTVADRPKMLEKGHFKILPLSEPGVEGFQLRTIPGSNPACLIFGTDDRGVLYGVGKLLRNLRFSPGKISLPRTLNVCETPKSKIRGHQLGYRNINNTYDAWSAAQYDQYIRELALFGANSIEFVDPDDRNFRKYPLMKLSPHAMLKANSQSCADYGLDVWIWYPISAKDLNSPKMTQHRLQQREDTFRQLPRLDAVFVPGMEHFDLPLPELFVFLEKMSHQLVKYHPRAKIWVSLQNSHATSDWLAEFFEKLNQQPDWLGGVVYGPWISISLPEVRRRLAPAIPIRRYPDIAHNRNCQYPVPGWDTAFELTQARESTNPRPRAMKKIHNALDEFAIGSIGYSDGINDDVNKFIWLAQEWNPATEILTTLREYARFFISESFTEGVAQGLLAEEKNWQGPLISNPQVPVTLKQWQQMEQSAGPAVLANYRFQMGLIRAYYDAFLQQRLIYETALQNQAESALVLAPKIGANASIQQAEKIFRQAVKSPVAGALRQRCLDLADSLHRSIGAQLTVEKHGASAVNRGAYVSTIDVPLNDVFWYVWHFEKIKNMLDPDAQLAALERLLNRTNPGPGGFYRNLGNSADWQKTVPPELWATDPGTFTIPRVNFGLGLPEETVTWEGHSGPSCPLAWATLATGLYEQPLKMKFENLDSTAAYRIRMVYSGQFRSQMRLSAGKYEVHPLLQTGMQPVYEFDLPRAATATGAVTLTWQSPDGERGAQVAEMWLILRHETQE